MAADIGNLDYVVLLAQDPPDGDIGRPTSLEMAMIAVLREFAIIGPIRLNRT
jgi:hypothetical protein